MKEILYIVAYDKNENLVKAAEAEKRDEFYCLICKGELILHKSGKTGKGSKRPHFAHINLTPNCNPETALHFSVKNLLYKHMDEHITANMPLQLSWECKYCYGTHSGNLLKKIKSVKLEYSMDVCKPDLALLDKDNNVFAVIEVVVTHKPEEEVLNYYKEKNIILIQIDLKSDKDIDELENKIAKPDFVQYCFNPKCKKCGGYLQKTTMTILEGNCWKCNSKMKAAFVEAGEERESSYAGPDEFTNKELEIAKNKGVIIEEYYSKTANERYLANTCPQCGTFIGTHYIFSDYAVPAANGEILSETFSVGYHCEDCSMLKNEMK